MTALLRREGWEVNRKAVQRLWGEAGLQVRARKCRRRKAPGKHCHIKASHPREIWSYDFVKEWTKEGRPVRVLSVVDEFTRECLALAAGRSMKADDVIDVLEGLMWRHGSPTALRSDNGPEFVARSVQDWLHGGGVQTLYIAPGCPWENGFVESFHDKLRDELLDREIFGSLEECQVMLDNFREEYNTERPHMSLKYATPAEFARRSGSAMLSRDVQG